MSRVCRALIPLAGKRHARAEGLGCMYAGISGHFSTPQHVFQGDASPGWLSPSRLLSTWSGGRTERGLIRPDTEIMFAFSFLERYRLS